MTAKGKHPSELGPAHGNGCLVFWYAPFFEKGREPLTQKKVGEKPAGKARA
jgi:hypothetical protein